MFRYIVILVVLIRATPSFSQHLFVGAGGAFDALIAQGGFDVRLGIAKKRVGFFADYYRYGIGIKTVSDDAPINEYYLNLNLRVNVFTHKKLNTYIFAGYVYSEWLNETKWGPGIYHGINLGGGCDYRLLKYSAFFEILTNSIWWEPNFMLGIKKDIALKKIFRGGPGKRYNLDLQDNNTTQ